jgi:peptidoglycan-associated lipoprotein
MTNPTRLLAVLFLGLAVAFAGCQKKPTRPNPSQTMVGPGAGSGLSPQSVSTDLFASGDSDLESRDTGALGDQQRGVLPSIYFDFDSASIRVSERPKLSQAANYLAGSPTVRLLLEGHCDWRGTTEYNMGLGDRRASGVLTFLETLGVDASRIETLSKGDLEANENASEEQMQQDRRVELVIVR